MMTAVNGRARRTMDFPEFAQVAAQPGAVFVADIAHLAGPVGGGAHPSPVGHASVITTTTTTVGRHDAAGGDAGAAAIGHVDHAGVGKVTLGAADRRGGGVVAQRAVAGARQFLPGG